MKEIELGREKKYKTIVDDEDYEVVSKFKWHWVSPGSTRYAVRKNNGKCIYLHRFIMGIVEDPSLSVDHINGNGLDNRRGNLRLANKSQNGHNAKKNPNAVSRYKGVHRRLRDGKWIAECFVRGKKYWLGAFAEEDDAGLAYNECAKEHCGEFSRLNKIYDK